MTATLVLALRKYTKVRLLTSGAGLGPRIRKDDKLKVPASREAQNERTRTVILANARTQAQNSFGSCLRVTDRNVYPTSPPPYLSTNAGYPSSDSLSCSAVLGFLCALGRIGL